MGPPQRALGSTRETHMSIRQNNPNLFLVGAPKSATTAIAYSLSKHNDIFLPSLKEPRYFDAQVYYDFTEDHPIDTIESYLQLYNSEESEAAKYRIDASVFNMYKRESIENILRLSPDAKFMVILRDPVEASVSMHGQRLKYSNLQMREMSDNFMDCWNLLEDRKTGKSFPRGCKNKFLFRYDLLYSYEKYIPTLIEMITKENLLIIFYEDFVDDYEGVYSSIFNFLEIETVQVENELKNQRSIVRKSKLLRALETISQKTFFIRNKFGIKLGLLRRIYKKILDLYTIYPNKNTTIEDSVYAEFEETYKYLRKLKNSGADNRCKRK
jgi:hypothetical protein